MKNKVLWNGEKHVFHENHNFDKRHLLHILINTLFTHQWHTHIHIKINGRKHCFHIMYANVVLLLFIKRMMKWSLIFCNIWWYHYSILSRAYLAILKFTEETWMLIYFSRPRYTTFSQKCPKFWSTLIEICQILVKMSTRPPENPRCTPRTH